MTRRYVDFDERFGRHYSSYRPDSQVDQRPVAGNHNSGARANVLHADVVVHRVVAKPGELAVESIAALQIFRKEKLLAANFSQRI